VGWQKFMSSTWDEYIPVSQPFRVEGAGEAVARAVDAGDISGRSRWVGEFEEAFAAWIGQPYAAAVSSGTAAVHLALLSVGVGPGDEVLVPNFTMIAPIFAIHYCGAIPVFIDADDCWNLDPEHLRSRLTSRTRAILVVHTYGHPANMPAILDVAEPAGLPVIEDAAEALGARAWGRAVGSFGTVSCFSFYANKAITTGEGGMVVTRVPEVIKKVRALRNMCFGPAEARFTHESVGFNYRMSGLQAALGCAQLPHLPESVRSSRANAAAYRSHLANISAIALPPEMNWAYSSYWVFGILIEQSAQHSRDAVRRHLAERGIETRPFFQAAHRQPFLADRHFDDADYPRSSALADQGLYLPNFQRLAEAAIDRICVELRQLIETSPTTS
jgi:perosamine synthetase